MADGGAYIDPRFAGILAADPTGAGGGVPAAAPMASPDPMVAAAAPPAPPTGGGVMNALGGLGGAVTGILGIPLAYGRAVGSVLSDVPGKVAAERSSRDLELARQQFAMAQAMQIYKQVLAIQDPQQRMAALGNLPEYAKSLGKNVEPQSIKGGDTTQYYGPGGPSVTAPLVGVDSPSGKPYVVTPDGSKSFDSLGGDFSAKDGIIMSGRSGGVAGTYSQPQKLEPGVTPGSFTPSVNGSAFNGGGFGGELPPASTAPAGPAPTAAGPVDISWDGAPLGVRNNNWGNVRALPHGQQWKGQVGTDKNGYAVFSTPQDGIGATLTNLRAYATKHGLNTVSDIISRWAPAAADHNNTNAYIGAVSQSMGVAPNQKLDMNDPATMTGLAKGIFTHELGADAFTRAVDAASGNPTAPAASGAPSATPAAAPSGWTVGSPAGSGYKVLQANEVPGGKPGTVYKQAPNGDISVLQEPQWTPKEMLGLRDNFLKSQDYQNTSSSIGALNGLSGLVAANTKNGITDMAALDSYLRALNPQGAVRNGTVQVLMEHVGLPQEIAGKFANMQGQGFTSPDTLRSMVRATWQYAKAHRDLALGQLNADQTLAGKHGFSNDDLGESLPDMPTVPAIAQDPVPPLAQRKAGMVVWSPKGPAKWNGHSWDLQ